MAAGLINRPNSWRPSRSRAARAPFAGGFYLDENRLSGRQWLFNQRGRVAQLVEQRIENPRVVGSIPTPATIPRFGRKGLNPFHFMARFTRALLFLGGGVPRFRAPLEFKCASDGRPE